MGSFGFQEWLILSFGTLYVLIPILLIIWIYKTYKRSKLNVERINKLERMMMDMEVKLKEMGK